MSDKDYLNTYDNPVELREDCSFVLRYAGGVVVQMLKDGRYFYASKLQTKKSSLLNRVEKLLLEDLKKEIKNG